jgi:hypothetical protein
VFQIALFLERSEMIVNGDLAHAAVVETGDEIRADKSGAAGHKDHVRPSARK